jgi:hypothetical protein
VRCLKLEAGLAYDCERGALGQGEEGRACQGLVGGTALGVALLEASGGKGDGAVVWVRSGFQDWRLHNLRPGAQLACCGALGLQSARSAGCSGGCRRPGWDSSHDLTSAAVATQPQR